MCGRFLSQLQGCGSFPHPCFATPNAKSLGYAYQHLLLETLESKTRIHCIQRMDRPARLSPSNLLVLCFNTSVSSTLCSRPLNADFVTWRGHLTKVLTTPYEAQDGWLLAVSLFRGTLYISEIETESARRQREQRPELLKEFTYMGYKFEQYMCAGEVSRK